MSTKSVTSNKMVASKKKPSVASCSTPAPQAESPSRDSDSEAASPVPFLCTQDGAEGETEVVWNFYTPKSDHVPTSRFKNSTPLSTKTRKSIKPKLIQRPPPKRRALRSTQKNTELYQELLELNQNLHEIMAKKTVQRQDKHSGSEDDIFSDSPECSPKSGLRTSSRCLRKNVLSSKFNKPDPEPALESDDSMNECLLKASQVVEENIIKYEPKTLKRNYPETNKLKGCDINDSMDTILNNINLDSPNVRKLKKIDSPCLNNDSFDNLVGNLNDSALERLTQMPVIVSNKKQNGSSKNEDWMVREVIIHDGSPLSKSFFTRHSSMPESPSVKNDNQPSTSGMVFGRYNSMPFDNNADKSALGDSPIRCTPDEIKRKHQQAREKLLAKRLPFTSSQQISQVPITQQSIPKKSFQPLVKSNYSNEAQKLNNTQKSNNTQKTNNTQKLNNTQSSNKTDSVDIKQLIEKKRQEALMKLRRRQASKV